MTVKSGIEKVTDSDNSLPLGNPNGHRGAVSDDVKERINTEHLKTYFGDVLSSISEAGSLYVLGPGEAKGEFVKQMEKNRPATRISAVETAGMMTMPQLVAKAKEYFAKKETTAV